MRENIDAKFHDFLPVRPEDNWTGDRSLCRYCRGHKDDPVHHLHHIPPKFIINVPLDGATFEKLCQRAGDTPPGEYAATLLAVAIQYCYGAQDPKCQSHCTVNMVNEAKFILDADCFR